MLQDQTSFLIIMAFIGLAAIYLYYRYPPFEHGVVPIAIGMMLGGAAGNLIDRIRVGRVTDFIDFRFWPAFNVADSSISIGIVVLLAGYIFLWPATQDRPPDADG
jgi:signal peptidase II